MKIKITPFETVSAKSGISISQQTKREHQCFRIGITLAAQIEYFGGAFDQATTLRLEIDDIAGKSHMLRIGVCEPKHAEALSIAQSARGSAGLYLAPWCKVAPGKRAPVSMPIVLNEGLAGVFVKLPQWARPETRKVGGIR